MFRCELCSKNIGPRIPAIQVVLEAREKQYPFRKCANRGVWDPEEEKMRYPDDPGGLGWETVKAVKACKTCADQNI